MVAAAPHGIKREGPFLVWGTPVTIAGDTRPVLSTVKPLVPPVEVVTGPNPEFFHLRVVLPEVLKVVPWLVLESVALREGTAKMMRSWPVPGGIAGTRYDVAIVKQRLGDATAAVHLWPCPDLATRDVETGELTIPPHAALTTAIGLEPATFDTSFIPVAMTVAAVADGAETVLRTTTLESRFARQGWTNVTVPLDALAGRTVRLRFRARPTVGPTQVLTLPLWADPTIVAAAAPAS